MVLVLCTIKRKLVSKDVKRRLLKKNVYICLGFWNKKEGNKKSDKTHNTTHVLDISHGKDDALAA